ncbi:MAG: YvcK family protein [Candidatus Omnitrophica bacterium]|nr:YvcK family protein [Candidatus Omnitrophota bacterium]
MPNKINSLFKWFYPGIGLKRWIALSTFGIIILIFSSGRLRTDEFIAFKILDAVILFSGIIILILGVKRILRSLISVFVPVSRGADLLDIIYQNKQINRGPKVTVVGGGTGLSVLLTGLKQFTSNISAIVTVADDGGSSGRIREEFDILPPGDIRNCLVALADAPALMRDLFQFRFDTNSQLSGHSFGNLFITVMTRLTGDFEKAIKETSKVLALRGQVIPSTLNKVVLAARHKDGTTTVGENNIPKTHRSIERVYLNPDKPQATPDAIKAIKEAQVIVLGPGSLYTSIIPNLLIKEIVDAIVVSDAVKVYVCNVMTQPGETDGYSVSEHIRALIIHSHPKIMDYCVVNTSEVPKDILRRYADQDSYVVVNDRRKIEEMGYRVIEDDFVTIEDTLIRHDYLKLAKIILGFIEEI